MRLLSAGPCCEIKGHSHWMSNPCSDLFSRWPMGKSSAIRTGGASFIIVVIIFRIIAGAAERRLASPFNSSRVSSMSAGVGVSGNIGSCGGNCAGRGKRLARPEKGRRFRGSVHTLGERGRRRRYELASWMSYYCNDGPQVERFTWLQMNSEERGRCFQRLMTDYSFKR